MAKPTDEDAPMPVVLPKFGGEIGDIDVIQAADILRRTPGVFTGTCCHVARAEDHKIKQTSGSQIDGSRITIFARCLIVAAKNGIVADCEAPTLAQALLDALTQLKEKGAIRRVPEIEFSEEPKMPAPIKKKPDPDLL